MLQALLEERFKLKTRWEMKEGDVYNLELAKGGPNGQGYDFIAHGCPMDQLVEILMGQFGRPVIDKTGLTGEYDFVLKYKGQRDIAPLRMRR